jgi:solute carrier family 45, member 1/2/4
MSKSTLSLVWIAGPLFGVLVQPYIGIKSDNCRSKWGRRRPYILTGGIATIFSFMALAWTEEIIGGFLELMGMHLDSDGVKRITLFFAVLLVYTLDFAINFIQAAIRAFVVDCTPTHQQDSVNAWAARMNGLGNILGYLSGYVNLPALFPYLGDTQFKVLCAIASLILGLAAAVSCISIPERDPRGDPAPRAQGNIFATLKGIHRSIRNLPLQIKHVCKVQFFAWMAWFPFLFYITTFIGNLYVSPIITKHPEKTENELKELWEEGTRKGTLALFIFALTSFFASVFMPFIVAPTSEAHAQAEEIRLMPATTTSLPSSGHYESPSTNQMTSQSSYIRPAHFHETPQTPYSKVTKVLEHLQISSLTLQRAWMLSHISFAACITIISFLSSAIVATFVVALIGIPWAVSGWAPYALISSEVSKRDAIRRGLLKPEFGTSYPSPYTNSSISHQHRPLSNFNTPSSSSSLSIGLPCEEYEGEDQAGIVFGIHNVAISAPQVISTILLSAIFSHLQKPRSEPGDQSVAWVLRMGGLCALVAAALTRRIGKRGDVKVKE